MSQIKRLYRSRNERMVTGVCGGLAEHFEMDPTVVRLIFVVGFFASASAAFWIYPIMALVVPLEPENGAVVEVIPPQE